MVRIFLLLLSLLVVFQMPAKASDMDAKLFQAQLAMARNGEDAASQYGVARMYEGGMGTKRDLKKSLDWYVKAATNGDPRAKVKVANWSRMLAKEKKKAAQARQQALANKPVAKKERKPVAKKIKSKTVASTKKPAASPPRKMPKNKVVSSPVKTDSKQAPVSKKQPEESGNSEEIPTFSSVPCRRKKGGDYNVLCR